MLAAIIDPIAQAVTGSITAWGYWALALLMGLESANIPIPSELIMPFGGFMVAQGRLNLHLVALAGALGCVLGSVLSYWLGLRLGRPLVERYGRYLMIGPSQLKMGDRLFGKYGQAVSFVSRLLPVVRTFISLIAGVWRVGFWPFVLLTFIGSWIWSYLLAYVGLKLGEKWQTLGPLWHRFDAVIVGAGLVAVGWYVWHHVHAGGRGEDRSR